MPEERVELSRGCPRGILSPLRLPFRHSGVFAGPQLSAGAEPVEGALGDAGGRSPCASQARSVRRPRPVMSAQQLCPLPPHRGLALRGCSSSLRKCTDYRSSNRRPIAVHGSLHRGARMQGTLQTTTTFSIEGYRITEYKGLVRGIVVRSPTISQGILGGLKQIVGGQIGAYAEMCEQARQQAYDLLLEHARALRANAIVGLRYESSEVGRAGSATEVLCYGTAVVIQPA